MIGRGDIGKSSPESSNTLPRVVVTVLTYNLSKDTIECVKSLQDIDYPSCTIHVVDNGSTDGSFERLKDALPGVPVHSTGRNLGYTGGVNACLRYAKEDDPAYVLVLNNDTVVTPQFLRHLVHAMEKEPGAAAACGTIYCHHDPERVWFAGGRMVPWRGLALHDHAGEILKPEELGEPKKTDFLNGCMVLFRTSVLDQIGGEDERFFMVLDDIELSARIQKKGFSLLYVPRSIIYHKVLGEDLSPFKIYYAVRNRFLLINVAFEGFDRVIARLYFSSVIVAKLLYWRVANPKFFRATWYGIQDYRKGRFGAGRGVTEFVYRTGN